MKSRNSAGVERLNARLAQRASHAERGWEWAESAQGRKPSSEQLEPDTTAGPDPLASRSSVAVSVYEGSETSDRAVLTNRAVANSLLVLGPPPRAPLWKQTRRLQIGRNYPMGPIALPGRIKSRRPS